MNSSTLSENTPGLETENARRYKFIAERSLHLRIVEEFLTQIELTLLTSKSGNFDFENIRTGLRELKEISDDPDRRKRLEFKVSHELLLWQEDLAIRDAKIEAYHIRRYCDGLKQRLDSEVFVALARFYRSLPFSKGSMSKFDLAITRAFSSQVGDLRRCLVADQNTLSAQIAKLFETWDKEPLSNLGSPRDVQVFDRYIDECLSFEDFQLLTDSRLFDRVREFKMEIGERFFHPAVVAAAVECNIAIGNRLNYLMAKAAENLGERLGSEFDFAGALQDTSPNAGNYIAEVLRDIDSKESLITVESESEDLFLLRSMLDLAADARKRSAREIAESASEKNDEEELISTALPEFKALLGLIDHQNPDVVAVRKRLDASDAFKSLDFNDFLFLDDGSPDLVSRKVLKTILSLESLRAHELSEKKDLSHGLRYEVMSLLAKAEDLGDSLEREITVKGRNESGRLLFVSNKLLETRLRMERSIVRFSSKELGLPEFEHREDELIENELLSTLSYVDTGSFRANRWLVAATVVVVAICVLLFISTSSGNVESLGKDVEILEPAKLPGGEALTGAHRQGNILYAVGSDEWKNKSNEQKTGSLKSLVDSPTKTKLENVIVLDAQGQFVAELSPSGINIASSVPNEQ